MANADGNGEAAKHTAGVTLEQVTVLELTYNHETCQVAIGGEPMPISLAQMILGEALRLLEEQRRLATAQQIAAQVRQQQADQALAEKLVRHNAHRA